MGKEGGIIWRKIVSVIDKALTPRKILTRIHLEEFLNLAFSLAMRGICGSKNIGWVKAWPNSVGTIFEILSIACRRTFLVLDTHR